MYFLVLLRTITKKNLAFAMDLSAPVTGSVRPAAATSRRSFHFGFLPEIFCAIRCFHACVGLDYAPKVFGIKLFCGVYKKILF